MPDITDATKKLAAVLGCSFFLICSGFFSAVSAQPLSRIEIPSSFNPVGSGARALGMGGAFIAVADDATAASWNPGGLTQLERPEVSIVGAVFRRTEELEFGTNPEGDGHNSYSNVKLNYLSATYPFALAGHNMVVSLNYQTLYDLTREWNFPLNLSSPGFSVDQQINLEQNGTLAAWGLAYSIQVHRRLSIGATLNLWEDGIYDNKWKQRIIENGSGVIGANNFTFSSRSNDRFTFKGVNANFGLLWNATPKFNIGAVFKTPFKANIRKKSSFFSAINFPGDPGSNPPPLILSSSEHLDLDMPMSYGIGFAYRFSDNFTTSLDIYRTHWDDFELKDNEGNKTSPVSGRPSSQSDVEATYQVRMGAEYLFIAPKWVVPLRAGVFYDPAPADNDHDNPADSSQDEYYGFSLGTGLGFDEVVFDIAYQFRWGNNVGGSILKNLGFSEDVREHTLYTSMIIYF